MRRGFLNRPNALDCTSSKDPFLQKTATSPASKDAKHIPSAAPSPTVVLESDQLGGRTTHPEVLQSKKVSAIGWPIEEPTPTPPYPDEMSADERRMAFKSAGITEFDLAIRGCKEGKHIPYAFCAWVCYSDVYSAVPDDGWGPPPPTPSPAPYRITSIPGCGMGMIATRKIEAGETILIERPLVLLPAGLSLPNDGGRTLAGMLNSILKVLGPDRAKRLSALSNCKPPSTHTHLWGVLMTNAIHTAFPQSIHLPHYAGVFPEISRCNHSCGPNVTCNFNPFKLTMEMRASRRIDLDEEITYGYLELTLPHAERQEELESKYSFKCTCLHCSPTLAATPSTKNSTAAIIAAEIAASDKRRRDISDIEQVARPIWNDWLADRSRPADEIFDGHMRAIKLIAQEGMHGLRGTHVAWIALAFAARGDEEGFRNWTEALLGACRAMTVPGPARRGSLDTEADWVDAEQWKAWVREPKTIPVWGLRSD